MNPHELQINFSFDTEAIPDRQVAGYRLYMEGDPVCETAQVEPQTQNIACTIVCEDGTYAFTLSALFDDSSESPQSAPFIFALVLSIIDPPTAVLSSSAAAGNAPLAVTFNGTSSMTPNPPIVSYNWTFGDGSQTTTGEIVSHTYSTAGTYYTELTVTDRLGLTDKVDTPIIVLGTVAPNEKPDAIISADLTEGNVPMVITFDGLQSSDPDGSITRYDWNFGDGTT
ncbi:MAG: PKD domain-containing protein, partial [Desulfobulbaceae bacterium]|nr:PKD domain-containing protein [Desulfobulbaceae bacterium]